MEEHQGAVILTLVVVLVVLQIVHSMNHYASISINHNTLIFFRWRQCIPPPPPPSWSSTHPVIRLPSPVVGFQLLLDGLVECPQT